MNNQEPNKKPMDIVAEQKLEKWLKDVGLDKEEESEVDEIHVCLPNDGMICIMQGDIKSVKYS